MESDHDPQRPTARPPIGPTERPLPRGRDAMRAPEVDRVPTAGNGAGTFYLVTGVLIALVLTLGVLFLSPGMSGTHSDQARQTDRPITTR